MPTRKIGLVLGAALTIAALTVPGAASAASCPPGQSGTPPYCVPHPPPPPPPPHCQPGQVGAPPRCIVPAITIKRIKVARRTVAVAFEVNAPGYVTVDGRRVRVKTVNTVAGSTMVTVRRSFLKKKRKPKRRPQIVLFIAFVPDGGAQILREVKVKLKQKHSKRNKRSKSHRHRN
jgi:hypothetical protein